MYNTTYVYSCGEELGFYRKKNLSSRRWGR
jgi:hypothetical protein